MQFTTLAALLFSGLALAQGPIQSCTKVITSTAPPCSGCTTTVFKHTTTSLTNCGGCQLSTTTTYQGGNCDPVCVGGIKTTTVPGTATVTACATSAY